MEMSEETGVDIGTAMGKPPMWFWVVVAVLLLWNAVGVYQYFVLTGATAEQLEAMGIEAPVVEIMLGVPAWATTGFAVAVFAGLLGDVMLVLRKAWARIVFVLSLLGVLIQHFWTFVLSGYMEFVGASALIGPMLVVVICLFQIWFAGLGIKRGWLR